MSESIDYTALRIERDSLLREVDAWRASNNLQPREAQPLQTDRALEQLLGLFMCEPHAEDEPDWPEGCWHCEARQAIRVWAAVQ